MSKPFCHKYYKQLSKTLCTSVEDDYQKAIASLNLLQSNAKDLSTEQQTPQWLQSKLSKLRFFLSVCDIEVPQLEKKLSVIHVTGTKGKGSTCAYCESILRKHSFRTGFFSSPHLVSVRERIRVDGQPVSREQFAKCFWDVHRKLESVQEEKMPPYFMFLTIMAFKFFSEEKVDVAIFEVGIGGEYDYTNILSNTAVVGISSLGLDHTQILGNTVEEIAYQKSGIMKPGCIAITSVDQPATALKVLQKRAVEKKCDLFIAPQFSQYLVPSDTVSLGIEGPAQKYNASLAIQLVYAWMLVRNLEVYKRPILQLSKKVLEGLNECRWPGRTQTLNFSSNMTYYLDGAHTVESMRNCVGWYRSKFSIFCDSSKKILVFNMTGDRDSKSLMELLRHQNFDYVIFCSNRVNCSSDDLFRDNADLRTHPNEVLDKLLSFENEWMRLNENYDKNCVKIISDVLSVHQFLECLSNNEKLRILVTGSLHLIGAFLTVLDADLKLSYKT